MSRAPRPEPDADALHRAAREMAADYEARQRRLARTLHDRASQSLGSVVLNLELCRDLPLDEELRVELVAELRQSIAELRDLSLALRPALLDEAGLAEALRALARARAEACDRPVALVVDPAFGAADGVTAILAYRLAEAALDAALAHGGGPLEVRLDEAPGELRLELHGEAVASIPVEALDARCRLFGGNCERSGEASLRLRLPRD